MNRLTRGLALAVLLCAPLLAGGLSSSPRELGIVVLKKLEVRDGKVIIQVDSGGCTDKTAIKSNVQKEKGLTDRVPQFVVTFERVRVDDCKAMLFDGTELEYELADDLGIAGSYTLFVTNRIFPKSMDSITKEDALKRELISATMRALAMEVRGYEDKLKSAQSGVGPACNVENFTNRIAELKGQQETFQKMEPYSIPLATTKEEGPEAFFGQAGYGPVIPTPKQTLRVVVKESCKEGSILEVEGMTKSGPFYHVAGIVGNDYRRLKPGNNYELTLYLLYKREYFGPISDNYVYIAAVK